MDIHGWVRKDIGRLGETLAAEYLRRNGFSIIDRNVAYKTGELDIIARKGNTLHFIEVKTVMCREFPKVERAGNSSVLYNPADNLHQYKIHKVARTAEWYMATTGWGGEVQIDGVLVWLRSPDGCGRVRYLPQILE